MGTHFPKPGLFDIRDDVCLGVGGFRHGQVIEDEDGDHAVVVGVRPDQDGVPKLWFKCDGNEGAGVYSIYHLVRKEFKLVGTRKLHDVSPSDPVFQNRGNKKSMLEKLLKGFSGLFEREQEGKLDSDFEFDYTFRYLQKSCHPALFDIRDEVCMPIGGFKHGDLVKCGGHTMVVIGVRPDTSGTSRLWMHVDGSPGAGVFEHQDFIRMAGTVIGKRKVEEYKDPVSACLPEFVQNLQPSFRYPIGVRGRTRLAMFDIRDEVCLLVSGCKHGERLKYKKLEMIGIGVVMDDGAPEMFLHVVKPKRSPGAGKFDRLKIMRPFMKSLGQEAVQEASGDILPECSMPSMSSSSSSEDDFDMCASSEDSEVSQDEGQPVPSGVMPSRVSEPDEGQVAGHAVLLSLSHTGAKVKDVLLHSQHLADCRQDVAEAGCEVTPSWANGAVLLMPLTQVQAEETQLDLRPHHIVALNGDKDRILAALQTLPCRSRPKIRNETGLPKHQRKQVPAWKEDVDLILTVDRTFLTCIPAAPSEAALESAPCGDMNSAQPVNPRKRGN